MNLESKRGIRNAAVQLSLFFHFAVLTRIGYASDGADSGQVAHFQVSEIPVLARPDVQHPASEVRLLKHQPVAVHHVAGLAVGHAETLHHVVAVIHELVHLSSEVLPLVDPHSEGSPVLYRKKPPYTIETFGSGMIIIQITKVAAKLGLH